MNRLNRSGLFVTLLLLMTGIFILGGCDSGEKMVDKATGNQAVKQYHKMKEDIKKIADQQAKKYNDLPAAPEKKINAPPGGVAGPYSGPSPSYISLPISIGSPHRSLLRTYWPPSMSTPRSWDSCPPCISTFMPLSSRWWVIWRICGGLAGWWPYGPW